MTPEEVEVLLRRIPELQPPPGLEGRLSRRPPEKRFPAGIAIAASFLFCLGILWLVFDRNQPAAVSRQDEELRIRINHEGACDPAKCSDAAHWDRRPADLDGSPHERRVVIHAPATVPWGAVQRTLDACAKAGYRNLEWSTPGADPRKVPLPAPKPPSAPERIILEQIRITLTREPGKDEIVHRVGNRPISPTMEDVMHIVLTMVNDYQKAGKTEWPIFIDPAANVPWKDVIQIVDILKKESLDRIEFTPLRAVEIAPAGAGPRPPLLPDEKIFAELQKELAAGKTGDAIAVLSEMIARHPESSYTIRGYTRMRVHLDGGDDLVAAGYRQKWMTLAPVVYDALLKPRKFVDGRGLLDPAALGATPQQQTESLHLYMELGYMQRELGRNGQKFQFDNASTVFSNVLRVVSPQSEIWWIAKYEVLATILERGGPTDAKLARVGLENIERQHPMFEDNKYGQKDRFLKLKEKILEQLKPK